MDISCLSTIFKSLNPEEESVTDPSNMKPVRMALRLPLCVLVGLLAHGSLAHYSYYTSSYPQTDQQSSDPTACYTNGRVYQDQEQISRDSENCYGSYCEGGYVVSWDSACSFGTSPCAGINVDVPGQCCPECIETTTPETTTPTEPPGCYVNGSFYDFDTDIPNTDPCKTCTCTRRNGVMCALASCGMVQCVNPVKKKSDCCATCPDGPNCWYGLRKIKVGETYKPSANKQCACPEPWSPLAVCTKLPSSKKYLKRKLRKQADFMNPLLAEYIENYVNSKSKGKK